MPASTRVWLRPSMPAALIRALIGIEIAVMNKAAASVLPSDELKAMGRIPEFLSCLPDLPDYPGGRKNIYFILQSTSF